MAILYLLRHIKSQWNTENRFAGWTDGPLDEGELYDAKILADKTINRHKIDKIYCSALFRNLDTVARMFSHGNKKYPMFIHLDDGGMKQWGNYENASPDEVKVFVSEKLNERYYGKLQGLDKAETIKKYGEEQVRLWRRSYDSAPPGGESLKDVVNRVMPFYEDFIENDLKAGLNVLVVASHNSLRAIAKIVEKISDEEIINFEIPYAGAIKYELDKNLKAEERHVL